MLISWYRPRRPSCGSCWPSTHRFRILSRRPKAARANPASASRLGRFFAEVGRPVTDTLGPPTPEEVANFVAVSEKYGYVLGTPEENAAVGITLPMFSSADG